jgi:ribosome biogenesis protein Nip4
MSADTWKAGLLQHLEAHLEADVLADDAEPPRLFLASRRVAADALATPWPTEHAGLPFGSLDGDQWLLSLEAAVLVAGSAPARTVTLTAEGAARFLYGRGVPNRQIQRLAPDGGDGRTVIVAGPGGTPLGLGRLAPPMPGAKPDLHNIVDLGWYLREGG